MTDSLSYHREGWRRWRWGIPPGLLVTPAVLPCILPSILLPPTTRSHGVGSRQAIGPDSWRGSCHVIRGRKGWVVLRMRPVWIIIEWLREGRRWRIGMASRILWRGWSPRSRMTLLQVIFGREGARAVLLGQEDGTSPPSCCHGYADCGGGKGGG